ncbi:MAG: RDD family protein [Chitinophagaceae bacterium]
MESPELSPFEEPMQKLVPASLGKRLLNYLVDIIIFSIVVSVILMLLAPVYPLANKLMKQQPIDLVDQLMVSFFYGLYMSATEALLKGKSIGKFITGTRAVTIGGQPIPSNTAFIRGLIRIIPFEQLSGIPFMTTIPYPWHDRWSGSLVIDEAKSILPPAE